MWKCRREGGPGRVAELELAVGAAPRGNEDARDGPREKASDRAVATRTPLAWQDGPEGDLDVRPIARRAWDRTAAAARAPAASPGPRRSDRAARGRRRSPRPAPSSGAPTAARDGRASR